MFIMPYRDLHFLSRSKCVTCWLDTSPRAISIADTSTGERNTSSSDCCITCTLYPIWHSTVEHSTRLNNQGTFSDNASLNFFFLPPNIIHCFGNVAIWLIVINRLCEMWVLVHCCYSDKIKSKKCRQIESPSCVTAVQMPRRVAHSHTYQCCEAGVCEASMPHTHTHTQHFGDTGRRCDQADRITDKFEWDEREVMVLIMSENSRSWFYFICFVFWSFMFLL